MSRKSLFTSRHARFLNRPGEHSDSSIMGEVLVSHYYDEEETEPDEHPGEELPQYSAHLFIRDCSRKITIQLDMGNDDEFRNTIEKLKRLEEVIRKTREDLTIARRILRDGRDTAREVTRLREAKEKAAKAQVEAEKPRTAPEPTPRALFSNSDARRLAELERRTSRPASTVPQEGCFTAQEWDELLALREARDRALDDLRELHDPGHDRASPTPGVGMDPRTSVFHRGPKPFPSE